MRIVRTAAFVVLCIVTTACGTSTITDPDSPTSTEQSASQTTEPGAIAPRMGGNYIGSGS